MGILNPARFNPVPSAFYSDVLIRGSAGGCLKIIGKSIFIDDFLTVYDIQTFRQTVHNILQMTLAGAQYLHTADGVDVHHLVLTGTVGNKLVADSILSTFFVATGAAFFILTAACETEVAANIAITKIDNILFISLGDIIS